MNKTLWIKVNDTLTEITLDGEQVREIFDFALRERIGGILVETMASDFDDGDYPGLSSLVVSDDVMIEMSDEVIRDLESCAHKLCHEAIERMIERHMRDYLVHVHGIATIRALTSEAAREVAEELLDNGELDFDDIDWDVEE